MRDDGELSSGRDFGVYKAGMDASLAVKIADICPHVRPGRIVDKGCGTGKMLLHISAIWPTSECIGLDCSHELLRTARSQPFLHANVRFIEGDVVQQHFPLGSLSTTIYSSVLHEVFSYNGYNRNHVRAALRNTFQELESRGRVIIRDGVKPPNARVWMHCESETEARFRRFARDFKGISTAPGVPFSERILSGQNWFALSLHDANEFLSKKDYLENWAIEVNEEFGVFTLDEWRSELKDAGFSVVVAHEYVNPWILEHRYQGKVWLHADENGGPGAELPFPNTTTILVGEAVY